jgi:hypothetical protein
MPNSEDKMKDVANGSTPLDELVFQTLSDRGEVIPQTVEEVARAEKYLEQHPPTVPESLWDPRRLLESIKARKCERASKVVQFPGSPATKVEEELAWAARNGTEITPEIKDRMRQNRAKALSDLANKKST